MLCCILCGECRVLLDPSVTSYNESFPRPRQKRVYCRNERFMRLFHNLRGLQHVSEELMQQFSRRKRWTPAT